MVENYKALFEDISNRTKKQIEVSVNIRWNNDRYEIKIEWEPNVELNPSEKHKMQDLANFKLLEVYYGYGGKSNILLPKMVGNSAEIHITNPNDLQEKIINHFGCFNGHVFFPAKQ